MAIRPGNVYPGETVSGDPAYPYGKARDETALDAFDGTPWQQTFVNDLFGFLQRILVKHDITPSDTPDTGSFSQYLLGLEAMAQRRVRWLALANHQARNPANAFIGTFRGVIGSFGDVTEPHITIFGDSCEIQTSNNGETWTKRSPGSGATNNLNCGVKEYYSVLAGDGGEIQTSIDGINWTKQTPDGLPYAGSFQSAAARPGSAVPKYLLAGSGGEIQTSPDAFAWTKRTQAGGFSGGFGAAVWFAAAGLWVIAGSSGEIQTSPDGIIWTKRIQAGGYTGAFRGAATNGKRCVLVGSGGEIQTSENGINWTKRTSNIIKFLLGVHWGASFVAVGIDGEILESLDGINWARLTRSVDTNAYSGVAGGLVDGITIIVGVNGVIRQTLNLL